MLVTTAASLIAGLLAHVIDQLLGLESLTEHGGAGSMLRLLVLGLIMLPIIGGSCSPRGYPKHRRPGRRPASPRQARESSRAAGFAARPTTQGASHVL